MNIIKPLVVCFAVLAPIALAYCDPEDCRYKCELGSHSGGLCQNDSCRCQDW
ncbi:hypothetical protein GQ42DRAFT_161550 [Ramicandelaber brevisporus]|nr:hypothetical protein GQ42DRAFT_161550 [Ramicandelaber brevisporus]